MELQLIHLEEIHHVPTSCQALLGIEDTGMSKTVAALKGKLWEWLIFVSV